VFMSNAFIPTTFIQPRRILIGSLMGALVVIGVALSMIAYGGVATVPPLTWWSVFVVISLASIPAVQQFGYRLYPLAPGMTRQEASREALMREQSATILRFVIAEAPAMAAVSTAFIVPGGFLIYLTCALVSLWVMWMHVWPHEEPIDRMKAALEANGQQSYLRELYGFDKWTGTDEDIPTFAHTTS
jgi:hypothetical protein